MAHRSASHFSTEINSLFKIVSLHNFSSCPFLFLQFPFLFRVWFVIEAVEERLESRPSIRSLSRLILNAWPGMIPFSMSIYAMPGVSFFNLCHCISAAFFSHNFTATFTLVCHIFSLSFWIGLQSDNFFFFLVLFCFVLFRFFRGKPKKYFWNSHQKGLLHRASSLVITPCSYQSYLSLGCWY